MSQSKSDARGLRWVTDTKGSLSEFFTRQPVKDKNLLQD